MTDTYKNRLVAAGVDVPTALDRFMGNEGLYEKFLKKFPGDDNFRILVEGTKNRDLEGAFTAAHTLKGVAGNLGLDCITTLLFPVVEKLRSGELDGVEEAVEKMEVIYDELCKIIMDESVN